MAVKIDQFVIEVQRSTETACKAIATAAELALNKIAGAEERAKIVLADDAAKAVKVEEKRANGTHLWDYVYKQGSLILTILTIFIGGFLYLTNPTRDNNTALQLQDQRITAQRQTIDDLTKTAQNDTIEVKAALKELVSQINSQANDITELTTIINERIPAKK